MFPKRKINSSKAREDYADGSARLEALTQQPKQSDMRQLASALDAHFSAIGVMLTELSMSMDMLFERIDNLERRLR